MSAYRFGGVGRLAIVLASVSGFAGAAGCAGAARVDRTAAVDAASILDTLSERVGGTVNQRRAGELIMYHQFQDPIRDCMRRAGFDYTPPPFVDMYAGRTRAGSIAGASWFAPIPEDELGVAADAVRVSPVDDQNHPNPGFTSLDESGRQRYNDAMNGCTPKREGNDHFPPSYVEVEGRISGLLSSVTKSSAVVDAAKGYRACMRRSGFDVATYAELYEHVQERVSRERPPVGRAKASPGWTAAVALDRAAATADATCRRPVHELAMSMAADKLSAFARDSADDIARVEREWSDMETRARQYPEAATYLR